MSGDTHSNRLFEASSYDRDGHTCGTKEIAANGCPRPTHLFESNNEQH
jgi:hypothetical protein